MSTNGAKKRAPDDERLTLQQAAARTGYAAEYLRQKAKNPVSSGRPTLRQASNGRWWGWASELDEWSERVWEGTVEAGAESEAAS
jgi:hypothetical protein